MVELEDAPVADGAVDGPSRSEDFALLAKFEPGEGGVDWEKYLPVFLLRVVRLRNPISLILKFEAI